MTENLNKEKEELKTEDREEKMPQPESGKITPEEHLIETHLTGLPGQEYLVAKSLSGEQLKVDFIDPAESTTNKIKTIEDNELLAVEKTAGAPLENQSDKAKQTIEVSRQEAADIHELAELFNQNLHKLLRVDSDTINNQDIPKEGTHYLITQADSDEFKENLKNLGYQLKDIGTLAFVAEKELTKLVFLFAEEKEIVAQEKE
ncbi:hypothetical protein ACFL2U_01545 [Patescibacteria group bacterium]